MGTPGLGQLGQIAKSLGQTEQLVPNGSALVPNGSALQPGLICRSFRTYKIFPYYM